MDIKQELQEDSATEWLKEKLNYALGSQKFCGFCLSSSEKLSSIETELVIGKLAYSNSLQDIINYVFKEDIENFMSSLHLCDKCVEKVIESYIFIHNTKQLSKVINHCVDDINSKVLDLSSQLNVNSDFDNANVMIVLDNNHDLYNTIIGINSTIEVVPTAIHKVNAVKQIKLENDVLKNVIEKSEAKLKVKIENKVTKPIAETNPSITLEKGKIIIKPLSLLTNSTSTPHYNTYKCTDCTEIFTTYRSLKEHEKAKHKLSVFRCELCSKCYNTQQYLNVHYKTHEVEKCKICQQILPEYKLMEHLRNNHANLVYPCKSCDLVYYSEENLNAHSKISHINKNIKPESQCMMCLRTFAETELKTHRCKFACLECNISTPSMKCIHTPYLLSFREQLLNHVKYINTPQ